MKLQISNFAKIEKADSKISFKYKYKIKGLVRFYKLGISLPEINKS